jgi:hypothetical protein
MDMTVTIGRSKVSTMAKFESKLATNVPSFPTWGLKELGVLRIRQAGCSQNLPHELKEL